MNISTPRVTNTAMNLDKIIERAAISIREKHGNAGQAFFNYTPTVWRNSNLSEEDVERLASAPFSLNRTYDKPKTAYAYLAAADVWLDVSGENVVPLFEFYVEGTIEEIAREVKRVRDSAPIQAQLSADDSNTSVAHFSTAELFQMAEGRYLVVCHLVVSDGRRPGEGALTPIDEGIIQNLGSRIEAGDTLRTHLALTQKTESEK